MLFPGSAFGTHDEPGDNLRHVIIGATKAQALPGERHTLTIHQARGLAAFNPSVAALSDGRLAVSVRVVQGGATTNWLGYLADNGRWILMDPKPIASPMRFEDLRLFERDGRLFAVGAHNDFTRIHMHVMWLNGPQVAAHVRRPSRHNEKNWMPLVDGDTLRFVYAVEPLIVLGEEQVAPQESVLGHLRGGSQLVPWNDGYLAVVHEVYQTRGGPVQYVHRFVTFDRGMTKAWIGEPWCFDGPGIEFCAGIAIARDRVLLSYGWQDKEARLAVVRPEELTPFLPAASAAQ